MSWNLTADELAEAPGTGLPERPDPHCIDRLVEAAPGRDLIASEDIRDQRGVLLWAKGKPVDAGIRERLIARRLLRPLESSLQFRDTLGGAELLVRARAALEQHPAVERLLGSDTQQVLAILGQARMQRGPGMLLTALAQTRPAALGHAILVASINIWLANGLGHSESMLLDAAESGLMHDLGEFYLAPEVVDPVGRLSFQNWRAMSVHPVIGCALVRESGIHAEAVAVAVREHHERVDGSGYPAGSTRLSQLGRLLLSSEVLATLLAGRQHGLIRAKIALQMIPGQFPREVVDLMSERLRRLPREEPEPVDVPELLRKVGTILERLELAAGEIRRLSTDAMLPEAERELLEQSRQQVMRYTLALHECGAHAMAANPDWLAADPHVADEVYRVMREMVWQLPGLHRHVELMVRSRVSRQESWEGLLGALDIGAELTASALAPAADEAPIPA